VLGMFYANTLRHRLPAAWAPGIVFSAKSLLRIAVALYGFRISVQELWQVGPKGLLASAAMLATTFVLGAWLGMRLLRLDRDTSLLVSAGSAVCGAAAVLATEPVLGAKPHKSAVAVGTVVLFGTISMFLYPFLERAGVLGLPPEVYGVYVGASVHEVAHVVAAGSAVPGAVHTAVIVKMARVMLLPALLLVLGFALARGGKGASRGVPRFALAFLACVGIHSLGVVPEAWVRAINAADTFMLTMAMTALGMETSAEKLRQAGARPLVLALGMYLWLVGGGYLVVRALFG
ncbi:MAG: YeiH family putative sulfate export transporter, partial [Zetaproteobacteria bacterium]